MPTHAEIEAVMSKPAAAPVAREPDNELARLLDGVVPPRIDNGVVVCESMIAVMQMSRHYVRAGMIPDSFTQGAKNDEQVIRKVAVAIEYGLGVGFTPLQSLAYIYPINGRPCLWGDGAISLVVTHRHYAGQEVKWEGEGDTLAVTFRVARTTLSGEVNWTEWKYTLADAKMAGLTGRGLAWPKHLRRMMFIRARAFALRDAFPDALRGAGIAEEYLDDEAAAKAEAEAKTQTLAEQVRDIVIHPTTFQTA